MTRQELREHYAGLAMQALITVPDVKINSIAKTAVKFADALLEEVKCKHEMKYTVHSVSYCSHCHQIILPTQPQIT